jgi:hypothetical protein
VGGGTKKSGASPIFIAFQLTIIPNVHNLTLTAVWICAATYVCTNS